MLTEALQEQKLYRLQFYDQAGPSSCGEEAVSEIELSCSAAEEPPDPRRVARFSHLDRELSIERSPETLHARGVLRLLFGELDTGISHLEEATVLGDSARIWNDLGLALLVRSQRELEPLDLFRGLDAIENAHRLDPDSRAVLFNRALALQTASLFEPARQTWSRYLENRQRGAIAQEARLLYDSAVSRSGYASWPGLYELLSSPATPEPELLPIVHRFPQQARIFVHEELLGRWARGRPGGAELAKASFVTTSLAELGLEFELGPALAELDASGASDPSLLREAWATYANALGLYRKGQIVQASPALRRAQERFVRASSVMADWPRLYLAGCLIHQGQLAAAERELARLTQDLKPNGPPNLLGRAEWMLAASQLLQGKPADALESFSRAREAFQLSGDREDLSAILHHTAYTLRFVGADSDHWPLLSEALELLPSITTWQRYSALLEEVYASCLEAGLSSVAHLVLEELIRVNTATQDSEAIAQALRRSAELELDLGRPDLAETTIARARQVAQEVVDPAVKNRVLANLGATRGRLSVALGQPRKAETEYSRALEMLETLENQLDAAGLYLELARAQLASENSAGAETSLMRAIQLAESRRQELQRQELRQALFEKAQSTFDELIELELETSSDPFGPLRLLERARSRSTLEARLGQAVTDEVIAQSLASRDSVAASIPEGVLVVRFGRLPGRIAIWVVGRSVFELRVHSAPEEALRDLLGDHRASEEQLDQGLRDLYSALIEPVESMIADGDSLILIPDRELFAVPLTALRGPDDRYLIQDHEVTIATSLTAVVESGQRPLVAPPQPPHQAVLGVTRGSLGLGLERIPNAGREAKRVASLLPNAVLRIDDELNKGQLLELSRSAELIHFAGHAYSNPGSGDLSFLFLPTDDRRGDAYLYAREIRELELDASPLIVLSACATAAGAQARSEAPASLAQAFLEAGARSVVASLWKIDDRQAERFFADFYRAAPLEAGASFALRSAILTQLEDRETTVSSPSNWGAYQIYYGAP